MLNQLKQYINAFAKDTSEDVFNEAVQYLVDFLDQEQQIYFAGSMSEKGFTFKQYENEGKYYYLAFTSTDEYEEEVLGLNSKKMFERIDEDEEVSGLIINPFSDCFVITSSLLSLLLDMVLYRTRKPSDMN